MMENIFERIVKKHKEQVFTKVLHRIALTSQKKMI